MELSQYVMTCPDELKGVLSEELASYGATELSEGFRSVYFSASLPAAYLIHLRCGTGSQMMQVVRKCSGKTDKIITSQAKRVKWHQIFDSNRTYRIDGVCGDRGENALSSNQISKAVRLGLEDSFEYHSHSVPKVDLKDPDIVLVAFVYQKKLMLSVQTTGKGLHKRGYRSGSKHPAPIKETLACAVLRIAGYTGQSTLWDPMCGSGTFAIEAAYLGLNKASLIHRKKGDFALEKLKLFDKDLWRKVGDDLRKQKREELDFPVVASDISEPYVSEARENALSARVERFIDFRCESFFDAVPPKDPGIIVSNLPYGERIVLKDGMSWEVFYKDIGDFLKQKCVGWRAFFLVDDKSPWKSIGLKPTKKWNLKNGSIPVKLVQFDVYAGRKPKGIE